MGNLIELKLFLGSNEIAAKGIADMSSCIIGL